MQKFSALVGSFSVMLCALVLSSPAFAEGTRTWEQSKFSDFEKGTAKAVAIRSDGALELAPAFKPVYTTPSTYVWSIAADREGNVYAAAGSPARVYRVTPSGQSSVIFQPEELQVQALVVTGDGTVYAATSPDGRVYRIARRPAASSTANEAAPASASQEKKPAVDPGWSSSVYFDPKTKYIWALAVDEAGRLYVATGDRGEIFRIERGGTGSLFFKSDEAHVRSLAIDPKGNLIAGSDGSGLVYRIAPNGEGFVLYGAAKKEITALAVDREGNIYAAGVGEKGSGQIGVIAPGALAPPATTITVTPIGSAPITTSGPVPAPVLSPSTTVPSAGGSEIYRIAVDGSPKRIWNSREDVVYTLGFGPGGRLLAGTGNRGRVFAIEDQDYTDLLKASATQVTAMANAPGGGLYVATSNLGKLFELGARPDAEGSYESDVFDARIFSRWGRAEVRGHGNFELFARSGNVDNPDRNWSPWNRVDFTRGGELGVPSARYVQWRVLMRPSNPTPRVDSVVINYLSKNVSPEVEEIYVQVGARFTSTGSSKSDGEGPVSVGPGGGTTPRFEAPPSAVRDRESIAVRWTAHDDNEDELLYTLYYRGDGEGHWKLLKAGLDERYFSFDSALLPDGGYTFRVVATDAPSHSPQDALTDSRESQRFEVDTTPPQVQNLNAALEGNTIHLTFKALDGFSPIQRSEYSVDAGEWQYAEPVGQLSDSRVENYDFNVPVRGAQSGLESMAAPAAEHVVVVRVYDRFENMSSAKTVVRTAR